MNERIKELAEQAGFHFDEYNEPTKRKAEKFAELIIQDVLNICNDIARPQSNGDDHKFTPGAKAVDKLVRKFYGVEE